MIRIDQMRNANHNEGRMADQKSIVNFREQSKDKLAYWLADRMDQLAFLTLSGVTYDKKTNGASRTGSDFVNLEFAPDVKAPSDLRKTRWDEGTKTLIKNTVSNNALVSTNDLVNGAIGTGDYPCWEMFVQAKAYAKDNFIRGTSSDSDGDEVYHAFMTPQEFAKLKFKTNGEMVAWDIFDRLRDGDLRYSEDYSFCERWRAMGGKVWIDPSIQMGHVGLKVFQGSFGAWEDRPSDNG